MPALCLLMHYADGFGTNTLTDGFAVAEALRDEDPEGYELLTKYGYDAERDFVASRVDSVQEFNRGLVVSTQFTPLQLDDAGRSDLCRIPACHQTSPPAPPGSYPSVAHHSCLGLVPSLYPLFLHRPAHGPLHAVAQAEAHPVQ